MINYTNFSNFTHPAATMHRYHIIIIIIIIRPFLSHENIIYIYSTYIYSITVMRAPLKLRLSKTMLHTSIT
jgi:hypothetical protein